MKRRSPIRAAVYIVLLVLMFGIYLTHGDDQTAPRPSYAAIVPHHASPTCVTIELNNFKHRHILDHAWDAIKAGKPKVLHIARDEADANREASTSPYPTKKGYDRDEYPPAMSDEGGKGADVRYVRSSENRSAGSEMGRQLRGYPDGQCFKYEDPPRWRHK